MQGKAFQYHPTTSSYTMLRKWQWVFQRLNDYSDFSGKQTDIFFSQTCPTASCNKCLTPSSCWCRTPASCPATSPTTSSTRSPPSSPSSGHFSQVRISFHTSRKRESGISDFQSQPVGWLGFYHSQLSLLKLDQRGWHQDFHSQVLNRLFIGTWFSQ